MSSIVGNCFMLNIKLARAAAALGAVAALAMPLPAFAFGSLALQSNHGGQFGWARGYATKCEVGLAYVIGQPTPLMQTIDTFGTATVSDKELEDFKNELIDTSVKGILEKLDLRRPIYSQTSAYGHYGKDGLPWEAVVQ